MIIFRNPWRTRRYSGVNAKYLFDLDHEMGIFRAFRHDEAPELVDLMSDAACATGGVGPGADLTSGLVEADAMGESGEPSKAGRWGEPPVRSG
jgi:hypothetical protein